MSVWEKMTFLFYTYSFMGWLGSTLLDLSTGKSHTKHGILMGPICAYYGILGVALYILLFDVRNSRVALFVGSCLYGSIIEYLCGLFQKQVTGRCLWDYSGRKMNIDGLVSLSSSLLWGIFGVAMHKAITPYLLKFLSEIPPALPRTILLVLDALLIVDIVISLKKAHNENPGSRTWVKNGLILSIVFFIGSFAGAIIETAFFIIRWGETLNRSTLLFNYMSIPWGSILMLLTWIIKQSKQESSLFYFVMGVLLGATFEYAFSVITGILYGIEFWNYSSPYEPEPFSLLGRISLSICLMWGIASLVWFRFVFPFIQKLVNKWPLKPVKLITCFLTILVLLDLGFTSVALSRWSDRQNGIEARNHMEALLDTNFADEDMQKVFTSAWLVPRGLYMFEDESTERWQRAIYTSSSQ